MYEVMRRGTKTDIWKNLQEFLSAWKCKGSSLNAFFSSTQCYQDS